MVKREKIGWIFIWTVATIGLALSLCFFAGVPNAQELTKEALSAKAAKAKVGDVLTKYDAVELIKADANKITAKIYATPKWDKQGNLLVAYETGTGIIRTQGRYVQYVPNAATGLLKVTRTTTETGVKEYWNVPDSKTTALAWAVNTDAEVSLADGRMVFTDRGKVICESPAPVAWDAKKKPVGITVKFDGKILTYDIAPGEYAYPLTVDPTTTTNASTVFSPTGGRDPVYANARDSAGEGHVSDAWVGQIVSNYQVYRAGLTFAGIPENIDKLSAATLVLDGDDDYSDTDFNICIFKGSWIGGIAYPEDFPNFDGRQTGKAHTGVSLCAPWSTSGYSADDNTFTFLSVGRDSIRACSGGTLRLMMVSSKDSSNTAPTGSELVLFTGSSDAPYLSLTYSLKVRGGLTRTTIYNREPNYIWKNGDTVPIWKP